MKCPLCGSPVYQHQISRRMQSIAQRARPSIKGTKAARERGRRAAIARWNRQSKGQSGGRNAVPE